jgi:hypothetical protein
MYAILKFRTGPRLAADPAAFREYPGTVPDIDTALSIISNIARRSTLWAE